MIGLSPAAAGIEAASHHVATAQARHARASQALAEAERERANAAERIAARQADRNGIIARRQQGTQNDDKADGETLALIAADLEGLATISRTADEKVASARIPVDQATSALTSAHYQLEKLKNEAAEDALAQCAAELEKQLLRFGQESDHLRGGKYVGRPKWGPSRELREMLHRYTSLRGEL